jgi:hypothetical protein
MKINNISNTEWELLINFIKNTFCFKNIKLASNYYSFYNSISSERITIEKHKNFIRVTIKTMYKTVDKVCDSLESLEQIKLLIKSLNERRLSRM